MQCGEFRKQGNVENSENRASPGRVKLPESYMQQEGLEQSSALVTQNRACKFCGRRACKTGLSKEPSERARSPEMQPPSCLAPSTENVLGGLRQLTLQQQAQVEKSAASNVRRCKPSHAPSTPGCGRVLEPELEYSEIESTDDTGSKYQRRKRALSATALKLWAKLSPLPLVFTISIAILAILISCKSPAPSVVSTTPRTCKHSCSDQWQHERQIYIRHETIRSSPQGHVSGTKGASFKKTHHPTVILRYKACILAAEKKN
jgi:hypothetical protein